MCIQTHTRHACIDTYIDKHRYTDEDAGHHIRRACFVYRRRVWKYKQPQGTVRDIFIGHVCSKCECVYVCRYVCVPFRRFKMFSSFHCSTFENIGQLVQYNEIIDSCEQRKYCGTQLEEKRVAMSCFDELIAFSFTLEHGLPEVIKEMRLVW